MGEASEEGIALRFQQRERDRRNEFSTIWQDTLDAVFAEVAPYYDLASNVASLGLCGRWRRRFIDSVEIGPGDRVLDVCAGTNGVGIELLRRQPDLRVFAIDRSAAMQEEGQKRAEAQGFNIESVIDDVHVLPYPDRSFDIVTIQWASRHLRVVEVFSEIRRVLRPGGCFYHCDMFRPENRLVWLMYSAYLKACLSSTALVFRSGSAAWSCRNYFVRALQLFYSAAELTELLERSGFSEVTCHSAAGGIIASHRAVKP